MKPLIAKWDTKTKRGTWPEVQVEFRHLHVFSFSNYNDPDPLWSCVIEKTSGDFAGFSPTTISTASERRSACLPERIVSNILVTCDEIRWRTA